MELGANHYIAATAGDAAEQANEALPKMLSHKTKFRGVLVM